MNKLVIAVAAVSSAFIPVAQAAYTSGAYYFTGNNPLSPASWGIGDGSETLQTVTEASFPDETSPVVFGETTFPSTFKLNGDATYKTFTAKNADGDTTIDLTSDSDSVTNQLTVTTTFTASANTLTVKGRSKANGRIDTATLSVSSGAKLLCENARIAATSVSGTGIYHFSTGSCFRVTGSDKAFKGKELIFEGEGAVFDQATSFNFDSSGQKIIVRDNATIKHGGAFRLSKWAGDANKDNELYIINGAHFENVMNARFGTVGPTATICISNTATLFPNATLQKGSRLLVLDAKITGTPVASATLQPIEIGADSLFVVDGAQSDIVCGNIPLTGENACFEMKNGATGSQVLGLQLTAINACAKITSGANLTLVGHAGSDERLKIENDTASLLIDDATLTEGRNAMHNHKHGLISLSGKNPRVNFNNAYTLGNADATEEAAYPTLKFTLPETEADVWTTAPVQVGTTATIGTNAKLVVEVPKTLIKKMSVPLLTAKTSLTVENLDALNVALKSDATIPEGATLAVGDWDTAKGKWVAAEGGKTLFINLPSRQGFMIILK